MRRKADRGVDDRRALLRARKVGAFVVARRPNPAERSFEGGIVDQSSREASSARVADEED